MFGGDQYIFESKQTQSARKRRNFIIVIGLNLFFVCLSWLYMVILPQLLNEKTEVSLMAQSPDLIVIFTGDRGRIPEALSLAGDHPQSLILISGVYAKNTVNLLLSKFASEDVEKKIDERLIELDYKARNTFENVVMSKIYLKKQLSVKNVLIVSSDYHLPRIHFLFSVLLGEELKSQIRVDYMGIRSHQGFWPNFRLTMKELVKLYKSLPLLFLADDKTVHSS